MNTELIKNSSTTTLVTLPNPKWNIEKCKQDALKYVNRTEWAKVKGSGYNFAKRHGWLDLCFEHTAGQKRDRWYRLRN